MLVKFFKTKNGGGVAGINYLLNHRVKDNTAFVLKGSEVITRQIVSNMTKKQKLCMGCLSLEEADIDLNAKQKIRIIRSFTYLQIPLFISSLL